MAKEPLVDFHLAFVADLPVGVEIDLAVFGGGFVVDNDEFPCGVDPDVVDAAGDENVFAVDFESDSGSQ